MAIAPKHGEFHDGKLWFHRRLSVVTVGVTSAAIEHVGTLQSIEWPDEGSDFIKGDTVVTIEGSLGKLEVIAPAAGVVQDINSTAQDEPDVVTEDPLEEGWLFKLEIEDTSDLEDLREG